MIYLLLAVALLLFIISALTLKQNKFGKFPSGKRLERIKKSPNYRDGAFQNQSKTPVMTGKSFFSVLKESLFGRKEQVTPVDPIPSVKTDLLHLDKDKDVLVWFGHSSYFLQVGGKRMLVDPVLSKHASPFSFSIKAFKGTSHYTPEDIPEIDYLFITHDHWDHLDYPTVMSLKSKVKTVICGLGVGENFEYWGYNPQSIIELDWHEQAVLDSGFVVNATPARHFSGRSFKRNQMLWCSYVLQTPRMKFFLGGDGGYDSHFEDIGEKFGPIDLALMENGQYNENWKYIHLLPHQILKAFSDLKAKSLIAGHSSRFALAKHKWSEPLEKISAQCNKEHIKLLTPMIGESVNLNDSTQKFTEWWTDVK